MSLKWFIMHKCALTIRRCKALLRAIIYGLHRSAFLKRRDGRMLMANAAAVTLGLPLSGLSGEETARECYGDMYGHNDWAMDHNDPVIANSAEQKLTFMTSMMPLYGSLKGIARDTAERIRMERQLRSTTQELAKKNALIADLFVNISHEFRTPLSVIQMAVEILDEHMCRAELDADRLRYSIDIINANTRRLTRLVGNMLDITKINAGVKQPLLSSVNIAALLRKLVELVKPYALRRGLEITLACRKTVCVVRTDAELVARIVVNLLSNAIKYTPRGGWVRVTCSGGAAGCRISVEDNGEGIPDDMQRLIFDHFHKANNTLVRSSEGCGIGLSLTRSLAELLGGSIWVKSTPGHGSAFFVDLPDRRETGTQQNTGQLSARLQDLVITELSDISI